MISMLTEIWSNQMFVLPREEGPWYLQYLCLQYPSSEPQRAPFVDTRETGVGVSYRCQAWPISRCE